LIFVFLCDSIITGSIRSLKSKIVFMLTALQSGLLSILAMANPGNDSSESSEPPTQSCLARLGSVAQPNIDLPQAIDGNTLKKPDDVSRLRKSKSDGSIIIIDGGAFVGWQFKGAKFNNLCFRGSDLSSSDWSKATASGLGFVDSKLTNANLQRANLPFVLFRTSSLDGANASKADFRNGQFDGGWSASISRLRLDGANLHNFRFECGTTASDGCAFDRQKVSLRSTNLSNSNLYNFSFWDGDFAGARIDGATVGLDQIGQLKDVVLDSNIQLRGGDTIRSIDRSALGVLRLGLSNPSGKTTSPCPIAEPAMAQMVCDGGDPALRAAADDVRYLTENTDSVITNDTSVARFDRKLSTCLTLNDDSKLQCLSNAYATRRKELLDNGEEPEWIDIQKRIMFVKTEFPLPADISSNPDWRNIAAIIASSSDMMLLVRDVDSEGRFAMRAKIADVTNGACSIAHDGLGFDNNMLTAVGLVRQKGRKAKASISLPVVQFYSDKAELSSRLLSTNNILRNQITNCGTDAVVGQMRAIPISAFDFDQLWLAMPGANTQTQ
jgi:uncharacterized protein YjbI with pentapeptide repeats